MADQSLTSISDTDVSTLETWSAGGFCIILWTGDNEGLLLFFLITSGVKIPRVKSKVKSKRKAEVVTPRR